MIPWTNKMVHHYSPLFALMRWLCFLTCTSISMLTFFGEWQALWVQRGLPQRVTTWHYCSRELFPIPCTLYVQAFYNIDVQSMWLVLENTPQSSYSLGRDSVQILPDHFLARCFSWQLMHTPSGWRLDLSLQLPSHSLLTPCLPPMAFRKSS
jgi:hypothetical protein